MRLARDRDQQSFSARVESMIQRAQVLVIDVDCEHDALAFYK